MTTVSSRASGRAKDPSRRSALPAVIAMGGLALALAACTSSGGADPFARSAALSADDYRVNHPITIGEQIETLDVPVSVDSQHLTLASRANIAFFAQSFLKSSTAIVAVVAPSGSPNQVAAAGIAVEVEDALRKNGVSPRSIDYRVYRAGADERVAPVRIAFNHIAATSAPCGPWSDDVTNTSANRHYGSFGCATQQNLAAVVDNPLDLLYPRGLSPADAARRADVLSKYRTGANFASQIDEGGGSVASGSN
jgi:pilus assembly protein CpaD